MRISLKLPAVASLTEEMHTAFDAQAALQLAPTPGWSPPGWRRGPSGVSPREGVGLERRGERQTRTQQAEGNPPPAEIPYSDDAISGIQFALPHTEDPKAASRPQNGAASAGPDASLPSEPSLEQIYRENATAIHRMMLRLGIPERYAEDATNDVFVAAMPRWDEFRGDSTRRTWLFGFALKVAANQRRKLGRVGEETALAAAHDFDTSPSTDADPFEQTSARQSLHQLQSLLETLTLEERGLWLLVHYEDVTVSDAAEVLGISAPKAYVMAKWIHAKLVKAWKRQNPPEAKRSW